MKNVGVFGMGQIFFEKYFLLTKQILEINLFFKRENIFYEKYFPPNQTQPIFPLYIRTSHLKVHLFYYFFFTSFCYFFDFFVQMLVQVFEV